MFAAIYRKGGNQDDHPPVVLSIKLANFDKIEESDIMMLHDEVSKSYRYDEDPVTCRLLVGIGEPFYCSSLYCIPIEHSEYGSIRSIVNSGKRFPNKRLPERFVAVILRQILNSLCYLHARKKAHGAVNAGNIFVSGGDPVTIKLGYKASCYFQNPRPRPVELPVWDKGWALHLAPSFCPASHLPENYFWLGTGSWYYEPSTDDSSYQRASDVFNVGITALELVLGPFCSYQEENGREMADFRNFLADIGNDEKGLPKSLHEIFMKDDPQLEASEPGHDDPMLSTWFERMVKRCLAVNPKFRPTAKELIQDQFFNYHDLQDFAGAVIGDL